MAFYLPIALLGSQGIVVRCAPFFPYGGLLITNVLHLEIILQIIYELMHVSCHSVTIISPSETNESLPFSFFKRLLTSRPDFR